jgi:hypothetical protein
MDYLGRPSAGMLGQAKQANQPRDAHRLGHQQPDLHSNEQDTPDDLHRGGKSGELGQPCDGRRGQLADRQPDSLDNEQAIPQGNGRAGVLVSITV